MRKAIPMGFVFLTIGIVGGSSQVTVLSAEAKPGATPKWEYRILTKEQLLDLGKKDLTAGLNKLGDEGWELVAVEPAYIFKRPKEQNRKQAGDVKQSLLLAQSDVEMWKDRVTWSERMVKKGYLTERQLQAEKALLQAAEIALDKAEKELKAFSTEPKSVPEK